MSIGFGLVRAADGTPRFDGDPATSHPGLLVQLTPDERTARGIWPGAFARDAQGTKRLTKTGPGMYLAEDALIAVSEIFDGPERIRLINRIDKPQGATLTVGD